MLFGLAGNFWVALVGLWSTNVFRTWQTQRIDPSVRATVLSMDGQVNALGQIAGGQAVGAIGNVSLRVALVVAGAILSPALLVRARCQGAIGPAPEKASSVVVRLEGVSILDWGEVQSKACPGYFW